METDVLNNHHYQTPAAATGRNMSAKSSPVAANKPAKRSEMDPNSYRLISPGHMLNDIVVEQYMQHVHGRLEPRLRDKVHLFSSFFYGRLKSLYLRHGADEGAGLEQLAKRWDRRVSLMSKDYLVVPVCDCIHWTLVIICFAHKAAKSSSQDQQQQQEADADAEDEEEEDDVDAEDYDEICPPSMVKRIRRQDDEPCLIVFDSLGHRLQDDFTEPLRFFLTKRWHYERPNVPAPNFMSRGVLLERAAQVPRQRNFYDCGVYLLHFFEFFFTSPLAFYRKIVDFQSLLEPFVIDPILKRNLISMVFSCCPEKSY